MKPTVDELLDWMREEPPFDEAERARLRRDVMARIRAEALPKPARRLRTPMLLLAASIAMACVLLPHFRSQHAALPVPQPAPAANAARALPLTDLALPSPAPVARKAPRRAPSPDAPQSERGPARIEFQTDNPTIRIIWLARATPSTDALTLPGGEP